MNISAIEICKRDKKKSRQTLALGKRGILTLNKDCVAKLPGEIWITYEPQKYALGDNETFPRIQHILTQMRKFTPIKLRNIELKNRTALVFSKEGYSLNHLVALFSVLVVDLIIVTCCIMSWFVRLILTPTIRNETTL